MPTILLTSLLFNFFPILLHPRPTLSFSCFCCLLFLAECVIVLHLMCYFTSWYGKPTADDMTNLQLMIWQTYMSSLGTLAPEASCYVFYGTMCQVYCRFDTDDMAFASALIWYYTHTFTCSTQTDQVTPPVMCSQLLSGLHWIIITHWYPKFIIQRSIISLLFKNYSRISHISAD